MWKPLPTGDYGLMNQLWNNIQKGFQAGSVRLPHLHNSSTIIVASDYSGQQKSSPFEAYGFVITSIDGLLSWDRKRRLIRNKHRNTKRRLAYAKLGDLVRQGMLREFLDSANAMPGLCVCLIIDKSIPSMFDVDDTLDMTLPQLASFRHYKRQPFERLLRVVHFLSLFIAGLSREGQDLFWFTDEDDIAANERYLRDLTMICGNIMSHYLQHNMRHIKCGTTASDDGSLLIEDLASISDLVSGALIDTIRGYVLSGVRLSTDLIIPPPSNVAAKSRKILDWFSEDRHPLCRLVYAFEPTQGTTALTIKRLRIDGHPGLRA